MRGKVLFLCPHGAAKSVMAAAYFRQFAAQRGLQVEADAAGTDPDEQVSPIVVELLRAEGIDVSAHQPRRITSHEIREAQRIVTLGCELEDLGDGTSRLEQWDDVPPVSADPIRSREALRHHVKQLVNQLYAE